MRRSFTGPLMLLVIGSLFLWHNLHPDARLFDAVSRYWPFVLIAWGLIRLIEVSIWRDPNFNAAERAFYYVRVIEIPTPRWTAYDAKRFGVKPLPGTRMTITERAYTSPIWYTPEN